MYSLSVRSPARRQQHHTHVLGLHGVRSIAGPHQSLHNKQTASSSQSGAAILQQFYRCVIVPVMHDPFQDIRIMALR